MQDRWVKHHEHVHLAVFVRKPRGSISHHVRVCAGFDRVEVYAVSVAVFAAHEEHDLDGVQLADLLDGRGQPFTLRGARGPVVEVAVHIRDPVVDGHPHLCMAGRNSGHGRATNDAPKVLHASHNSNSGEKSEGTTPDQTHATMGVGQFRSTLF